jgi:hypothetical protein
MDSDSSVAQQIQEATLVRDSFNGNLLEIMNQYGIKSESEVRSTSTKGI